MERQHLPVFDAVSPGDLCRVVIEATVEAIESLPGEDVGTVRSTVLARAKSPPKMVEGAWYVDCVGVGLVPAGRVKRIV